ncbi:TetR/AcrR family transcriptional regulator [Nocardia sp. NBC_00416]|uniref:TetR/AcrR family transcriptional regulator n=1 Tax=Nocardia sp. NBC_00416 TaxID=2975991 RepID=UPI002E1DCA3B
MSRADATKARILQAATAEFGRYGIAGARVDRIAATAAANKNLIYVYFGSKDRLFDAVFDEYVAHGLEAVPFTADDLPGYAGALYDYCRTHPDVLRLATWHRLERGSNPDNTIVNTGSTYDAKTKALRAAQRSGSVGKTFSVSDLLTLVIAIATAWGPSNVAAIPRHGRPDAGRRAAVEAVRRLIAQ